MTDQEIRIKLKSFDCKLLDNAARGIVGTVKRTGASVGGPIPLLREIKRFTVNRSPHVNKKSRDQYEIRHSKRLIVIKHATSRTVDALMQVDLPAGVEVEIKLIGGAE